MNALDVIAGNAEFSVEQADCLEWLGSLPENSVDLVFGSPPYSSQRLYLEDGKNMGIARSTEEWARWMVKVFQASLRVCRGLVAFVVEDATRKFRYQAGPALLMADLHRAGVCLRKPPIFHRVGIPGSGGPDWLRNDYEFIVCATNGGKLPWSDNTAMGHAPKWAPGGEMSHRVADGARVNEWGRYFASDSGSRKQRGEGRNGVKKGTGRLQRGNEKGSCQYRRVVSGHANGDTATSDSYDPPAIANPGNVISLKVGGGLIGDKLAHENEAPFPEKLAEFFVKSFCPHGGIVADCFLGSGTTVAVALAHGRKGVGCDLRASQVKLAKKRIRRVTTPSLFRGVVQ